MTSILSALVVLGILIFIHELGHFLTARACGVGVKVFSLGFGKKIFGFVKGNTEYKISLIPLGGYVRMVGEGPEDEVDISEKNLSFSEKPVWQRLLIVGSGPGANFLLAVFIYALILMTWGLPVLMPGIGQVLKGYPAEIAGLKKGDLILEVKEQEVKTWDQMADIIKSHGNNPLPLKIRRDDQILNLTLTPSTGKAKNIYGQDITKPMIGISPSGQTFSRKLGFFESITGGIAQTWEVAELTFMTVIKLIKREVPLSSIGGPIFIAQAAGKQAKAGVEYFLFFMGLISVNLCIINILPIPVLDGGHIFFFVLELIIRKPVSDNIRFRAQQLGVLFLLFFMGVVFYNDIARIVSKSMGLD